MIIGTEVNTLLLLTNTLNLEEVNPGHSHLFCTRLRCELLIPFISMNVTSEDMFKISGTER